MNRVHRVQNAATNDRVGYCLDVADLFMSKAAAGRDKDRVFCMALLQHGYVKPSQWVVLVDVAPILAAAQFDEEAGGWDLRRTACTRRSANQCRLDEALTGFAEGCACASGPPDPPIESL
jgi:hypothetical protein